METAYESLTEQVRQGAKFYVNFGERTLRIDKTLYSYNQESKDLLPAIPESMGEMFAEIERLYNNYKHSVPSERSESKRKRYFNALRENDLSDTDMLYGELREVARFELEAYVLFCIALGVFVWDEGRMGKWFWQSEEDKDLVILRQWVEPEHDIKNKTV